MMKRTLILGLIAILSVGSQGVCAQDTGTKAKRKPKVPRAFQPPQVDEALPNVLLLGDSISIGYTLDVRKRLAGIANVWRPAINCGPTTRGLKLLDDWIGDKKWDVIHFNFGLHDLKYLGPSGENLANPKDPANSQQVPIDQYAANLTQIAERLKQTGAKVIWCETTPVPKGVMGRVSGDAKRYNEAAASVMEQLGDIQVEQPVRLCDDARSAARGQCPLHSRRLGRAGRSGSEDRSRGTWRAFGSLILSADQA